VGERLREFAPTAGSKQAERKCKNTHRYTHFVRWRADMATIERERPHSLQGTSARVVLLHLGDSSCLIKSAPGQETSKGQASGRAGARDATRR